MIKRPKKHIKKHSTNENYIEETNEVVLNEVVLNEVVEEKREEAVKPSKKKGKISFGIKKKRKTSKKENTKQNTKENKKAESIKENKKVESKKSQKKEEVKETPMKSTGIKKKSNKKMEVKSVVEPIEEEEVIVEENINFRCENNEETEEAKFEDLVWSEDNFPKNQ